jgi:transcriptional regulator with XRE-family HTH domain
MAREMFVLPLSWHPVGGQGQPYDDDVVEIARSLMLTTDLTQREIAARVGVSHMTIGRWARAGRWRPFGPARRARKPRRNWVELERELLRPDPWGRLVEAERLLTVLERSDRPALGEIERALTLLLAARQDYARPRSARRKRRTGESNPPCSSC